jgi:hypothetical protein
LNEHQRDSSFLRLLTYSALEKHDLSEIFIKTKGLELIEFIEAHIKSLIDEGRLKDRPRCRGARLHGNGVTLQYLPGTLRPQKYFDRPNEDVIDIFVNIFLEGMKRR